MMKKSNKIFLMFEVPFWLIVIIVGIFTGLFDDTETVSEKDEIQQTKSSNRVAVSEDK